MMKNFPLLKLRVQTPFWADKIVNNKILLKKLLNPFLILNKTSKNKIKFDQIIVMYMLSKN